MTTLFALLRLGLGVGAEDDRTVRVTAKEWGELYKMAQRQGVTGIALEGVTRLDEGSWPPRPLLFKWVAAAEQIKKRNAVLDARCREVGERLKSQGLDCRILKGQGVACLYPRPELRQTGDIDVWVRPNTVSGQKHWSVNRAIGEIGRSVAATEMGRTGDVYYHHLSWTWPDVEVEVHYRPQAMNNPLHNRSFQRWAQEQWDVPETSTRVREQMAAAGFATVTTGFNAIYLLLHLYHHLLFEGLVMKQVCDYYLALENCIPQPATGRLLREFGLERFAGGMMWVLGEVFRLERERMITEPNSKEGRFILEQIQTGGSHWIENDGTKGREPVISRFLRLTRYRMRFLAHYPGETLWDIPFRLYHWCWRQIYK